ncbi:MAG: hypothetical protein ETSY2_29940 [Candidatus Entotheonella gemina]|uniref:CHAT domain-containing protein n=1 Tax=Candidatus Entotheonella gemina TaxID=1429439 RepID=W4M2P8_9BACT|nr:MAG: hypothetical protein ETSY2_29940 [Candidatus Entotheonella gemina]
MPYELIVNTDSDANLVRLRLRDENGVQQAAHQVRLGDHSVADWEGLFDTRRYVGRYKGSLLWGDQAKPATEAQVLERLGVFLGQQVLGEAVMSALTQTLQQRTLLVRLPATGDDLLAAAFARVPWEIARSDLGQPALMERNLIVRVVTEDTVRDTAVTNVAAQVAEGEPLCVLLVFAEAPGSRPLAMRLERERLLHLFYNDILPHHCVRVDVLCHGVTRTALREQIRAANGYHIVHWSGHGHLNRLELRGEDGAPDRITGAQLVSIFVEAGGFIPQLVFLSACLSGSFIGIRDWATLQAVLSDEQPGGKQAGERVLPDILDEQPGYTGTALALLRSGVPQVIAMRYEVGDDYARELAWWFYKRFFTDTGRPSTDGALALARTDLLQNRELAGQLPPVDHATPLVFGQEGRTLNPVAQRSEQLNRLRPRPQPLLTGGSRELEPLAHFVGRSEELTRLHHEWLLNGGPAVALVQGLAGLGKTVLVAEALHLWHRRFDWVLSFQAKPAPLTPDDFFRQVDAKLNLASLTYHAKCEGAPFERIFLEPSQALRGEARYEQMRTNLLEALRGEAVLLVLDNFETALEEIPGADGYACADPQWDRTLQLLARDLPGTRSRVMITSRHRPAVLSAESLAVWLSLGPLPMGEAGLYVRSHPALRALWFADAEGRALVTRLLSISRGHPLIMERLAALAHDHMALAQGLDRVQAEGWETLPDLFRTTTMSVSDRERERQYLEEVAIGSVDVLIERLSPDARRLLWILTLANEPVPAAFIVGVWPGQADPLLTELHSTGLLTREGADDQTAHAFHELVRERMAVWMDAHATERAGLTAEQVWGAYGEWYEALFEQFRTSGQANAREAAAEAGQRAVVYLVRARAFERLGVLASWLVTGTRDPMLLQGVIAELKTIADQVPSGRERWILSTNLADALRMLGRSDQTLALYEQAVVEAEDAEAWSDMGVICGNWANALGDVGQLDAAKATLFRSIEADQRAGRPRISVVSSELEVWRIDVSQGAAERVLADIDARLCEVRDWWQQYRDGQTVPEAPEPVFLGRVLIGGLDIAGEANRQLNQWQACLDLLAEAEQIKRELGEGRYELTRTRFNQYYPLLRLGRLDDAQRILEQGLDVFREAGELTSQATALSALADVWNQRGDTNQAIALDRQALSVLNRLPTPSERASSHGNLSNCLYTAVQPEESARHRLAQLVYRLILNHREGLSHSMHNLGIHIRHAAQTGEHYSLPSLAELLALPAFEALNRFVAQANVDVPQLQEAIDQLVEQARHDTEPDDS